MKLTALIIMTLLLTGCVDNPLTESKEEKAITSLEGEFTKYLITVTDKKQIKSYLQKEYPAIYKNDTVKILSFGSEPCANNVFINLKDGIEIKLTTPCIGLSCGARRDDVILYTKNKEKIKDAIKMYIEQPKEESTLSLSLSDYKGSMLMAVERIEEQNLKTIKDFKNRFSLKFVKAKVNSFIRIPIEGKESRIDIEKIDVLFNNGCRTAIEVKAEFLNLLDHRFIPDNIAVECDGRKYKFILLDLDGVIGLNTHFDKKSSSFVRELKTIEGVIGEEISSDRKQIKEKNTSPENFEFPTMDKDTQKSLEKTIEYLEKK